MVGGRFLSRIRANPELLRLLRDLPDIFVYTESCIYTSVPSPLPGYDLLLHTAKRNSCRRGIAVLFLHKYRYCLSKDQRSKKLDILWLKLKNDITEVVSVFFMRLVKIIWKISVLNSMMKCDRGLNVTQATQKFFSLEIAMQDSVPIL